MKDESDEWREKSFDILSATVLKTTPMIAAKARDYTSSQASHNKILSRGKEDRIKRKSTGEKMISKLRK